MTLPLQRDQFITKMIKNKQLPLHLIKCSDKFQRKCYFIIASPQKNINELKKKINSDSVNLIDYGTVIRGGFGEETTEEDKQYILGKYNLDIDLLFKN